MVRNDGTPDEKKFLGITPRKIRVPNNQYVWYLNQKIQAKDVPIYAQNNPELYNHYLFGTWAEQKKYQLHNRLNVVAYIVAFIELHQKGYRIVKYSE